jgi:hypothetical protein
LPVASIRSVPKLWRAEYSTRSLGQPFALRKAPEDWKLVQECLRDALESLWDSVWSYQAQIALESLR